MSQMAGNDYRRRSWHIGPSENLTHGDLITYQSLAHRAHRDLCQNCVEQQMLIASGRFSREFTAAVATMPRMHTLQFVDAPPLPRLGLPRGSRACGPNPWLDPSAQSSDKTSDAIKRQIYQTIMNDEELCRFLAHTRLPLSIDRATTPRYSKVFEKAVPQLLATLNKSTTTITSLEIRLSSVRYLQA